ncbi:MAG: hypothetical protein PF541_04550 [Prolixibacteraceae bacterium]|jgi:LSD1 subclass zinc finger protein|nr:hypothetical protein [Prolixibacteraceae bacterium]
MEDKTVGTETFACTSCGADLKYKAGTQHLSCEYCGAKNEIPQPEGDVEELNFHAYLTEKSSKEKTITEHFAKCDSCGASSTLAPNITASS